MSRLMRLIVAVSIISAIPLNFLIAGASESGMPANQAILKGIQRHQMHRKMFLIHVDSNNTVTRFAGNGYMNSKCYYYPGGWWNTWFHVGPYTPGRTKQVSNLLHIAPLDPNEEGYAEIAWAWSTPAWSRRSSNRPPLPEQVNDEESERRFIERNSLRYVHLPIGSTHKNVSYRHDIKQYSPEWLAVAVRGFNFKILNGQIMYEAGPPRTGTGQLDEARIREIVLQVIKENPELIQRTLNEYARTKRLEGERRQLEMSFKNRVTDIEVGSSPTRGPTDANITIFAFQDFECPYSERGAQTLEPLLKQYAGKTRLVFKNRPQTFHRQARAAAKAAVAAHEQGRFWEYHDLLFKNYRTLGEEVFIKLARELNLDIERFNRDRNSIAAEDRLNADIAEAQKHNFGSTPTFVINGVVVVGAKPRTYFENVVKRLLGE